MFRRIALPAICILYSLNLSAQNSNAFPEDRDGFLKAVTGMLTDTKRDDCKETAQQLEQSWSSIQSSMQGDIMDIAAAMRSRRMLVTPYFQKFFNAVLAFQQNTKDNEVWDQWKNMTDTVIMNLKQGNNKKYEDFLDFSYALFSKHALYISQGRTWKFDADIFDLLLS